MTVVCIKMGWDYFTFMAQPTWFVDQIILYYQKEYEEIKKANR